MAGLAALGLFGLWPAAALAGEPQLLSAVSRKAAVDVPLPIHAAAYGIENRPGGVTQIVLTFSEPVLLTGTTPVRLSGGSLLASTVNNASITLDMQQVPAGRMLVVALDGVRSVSTNEPPILTERVVRCFVLPGDSDVNRQLNSSDLQYAKGALGQSAALVPMCDFDADGRITLTDLGQLKQAMVSGQVVPTPSPQEASRFLAQASFGATTASIAEVQALGYEGWIDAQWALPASYHLPLATTGTGQNDRQNAWFTHAVLGQDQLRQRVAFALSEIFVISDRNDTLVNQFRGMTDYYDMLVDRSDDNFRALIEDVTLHPCMGVYLSMLRNAKPNPTLGTFPDENYAREVQQLFTIGLWKLNPDGTRQKDGQGDDIPTYDNDVIRGFAHAFTGWSYYSPNNPPTAWSSPQNFVDNMSYYDSYHDKDPKVVIDGVVLPAVTGGRTGQQDLTDSLDLLFNHPNTGPFICKQLIQRMVTSNPSREYVARVSAVFANNGQGVRGDMKAVIKAILLDNEARDPSMITDPTFGKIREPLIRLVHMWRAFNASSTSGKYEYGSPQNSFGQAALRAPSVFNFFDPSFAPPGEVAHAGLVAPEGQLVTETSTVTYVNQMWSAINSGIGSADKQIRLSLTAAEAAAANPDVLLDDLNLVLMAGQMSPQMRQIIRTAVLAMANNTDRAKTAIFLVMTSPEYQLQK